jgi:NitT/TauT family transport system substrate-binding protein
MKKLLVAAALAAMATGASAEDVKLQLTWVTQAQFAG